MDLHPAFLPLLVIAAKATVGLTRRDRHQNACRNTISHQQVTHGLSALECQTPIEICVALGVRLPDEANFYLILGIIGDPFEFFLVTGRDGGLPCFKVNSCASCRAATCDPVTVGIGSYGMPGPLTQFPTDSQSQRRTSEAAWAPSSGTINRKG